MSESSTRVVIIREGRPGRDGVQGGDLEQIQEDIEEVDQRVDDIDYTDAIIRMQEDIDALRSAINLGANGLTIINGVTNVNPTTFDTFYGNNLVYQDNVYYWRGDDYAVVGFANQIDFAFPFAFLHANGVNFDRDDTGEWQAVDTTPATVAVSAPVAPTASYVSSGDGTVTYQVNFDADNGGAAYTDAVLIYTPPGSTGAVRVSTGLTSSGQYTLSGLSDGENPNPVFVTVNASGFESAPSAAVSGRAWDAPAKYPLVADAVTAGEETLTITLVDAETNGPARTDVNWELVEVAQ